MAEKAEGAEVVEIALAAALGYGPDVVSVPEAAPGGDGLHAVEAKAGGSCRASGSLQCVVGSDGIDGADGADTSVAGEDLVAEVARVGAETPLVDAVVAAEGAAAFGEDLKLTPAAEGKVVGAEWQLLPRNATAGEGTWNEHGPFRIGLRAGTRNC